MIESRDPKENQECWKELATLFAKINNNLVLRLIFNGLRTQFPKREDKPGFDLNVDQQQRIEILTQLELSLLKRDSKRVADAITNDFLLVIEAIGRAFNPSAFNKNATNSGAL